MIMGRGNSGRGAISGRSSDNAYNRQRNDEYERERRWFERQGRLYDLRERNPRRRREILENMRNARLVIRRTTR